MRPDIFTMTSRYLLRRPVLAALTLVVLLTWFFYRSDTSVQEISLLEHRYPLLFQRVHTNSAIGGGKPDD